jgi:hypothetical protein
MSGFLQRLAQRGGITGNVGAAPSKRGGVLVPDAASRPWFAALERPANDAMVEQMNAPRLRRRPAGTAEADDDSVDGGHRRDANVVADDRAPARPPRRAQIDVDAHVAPLTTPSRAAIDNDGANGRFLASSQGGSVPSRVPQASRREAARARVDSASDSPPAAASSIAVEEPAVPAGARAPRSNRGASVGTVPTPRPASTLEMAATSDAFHDEGVRRAAPRDRTVASPASDGAARRRATPLPLPLVATLATDAADSRGMSEFDRSSPDGSRNARMRARAAHEVSPSVEMRAEPPRHREVSVHIGTIEIRESPPPAPTAAPRPTPARSAGFEEFVALRAYAPWRGR